MSALTKWLDDLDAKAERPCHGDACAPSGECSACIDTQDAAVNAAPILSRIVRAAVERPWRRVPLFSVLMWQCYGCGHYEKHGETCSYAPIDAALDAAEKELQ